MITKHTPVRNLLLLAVAALFLLATSARVAHAVSDADFVKMMEKVEALTKQNKVLTDRVRTLEKKGVKASPAQITDIQKRVETLEAQETDKEVAEIKDNVSELTSLMSDVERRSLLDRVHFNAEMRTRCDWFSYTQRVPRSKGLFGLKKGGYTRYKDSVKAQFSNRFRLNMRTELTDNVRFTGRLTMFKRWNSAGVKVRETSEGRVPSDTADLTVERAYVDYFFQFHPKLPMALTFGRLPISEGMPTDLKENSKRKSVYPALAWDVTGDGAGLTFMLEELTGLKESAFRLVYYRANRDNEDVIYLDNELGVDDLEVFFAQFETKLPGKYLEDIMFVTNFLYLPEFPGLILNKDGGPLVPYDVPDTFGRTWKLTFLAEAKQYLGSNFDWFISFSHSESSATEDLVKYRVFGLIPTNIGFIKENNERERGNGYCIYLGGRYTIPFEALNNPKFGIEYNYGSKYWTNTNKGSEDPLGKLNTRGYAWDFYYIQPINKVLSARLGYTWIRQEHPALGKEDDHYMNRVTNTYLLLDAKF